MAEGKGKDRGPRPLGVVIPAEPWAPEGDEGLQTALREDLHELLQFLRLRLETPADADPGALARLVSSHHGPCVLTCADVPGLPIDAVEGALNELMECDVVVGPCADGGVYLLGLPGGMPAELTEKLIAGALDSLEKLAGVIQQAELEPVTLPPWFRMRSAKDLSFAESLARLSLQSEDGDMDFLADRLKHWLSERAKT